LGINGVGLSRALWEHVHRLGEDGRLWEISRSLYRSADAPPIANLDLIAVWYRAPHANEPSSICCG
jgi:hypothetical protein